MQNPKDFICHEIGKRFLMKPNLIGPLNQYLGDKMSYLTLDNDQSAWSFSLSQYIQDTVTNVINKLAQEGRTLPKCGKSPCTSNYRPEIDTSPDLFQPRASYCQSLICIL